MQPSVSCSAVELVSLVGEFNLTWRLVVGISRYGGGEEWILLWCARLWSAEGVWSRIFGRAVAAPGSGLRRCDVLAA